MDRRHDAELLAELQRLWLIEMKRRLEEGEINSTDMATLARALHAGGMLPHFEDLEVPEDIKAKLKREVPADRDDIDEFLRSL